VSENENHRNLMLFISPEIRAQLVKRCPAHLSLEAFAIQVFRQGFEAFTGQSLNPEEPCIPSSPATPSAGSPDATA
jgi:hypothetical protein